MSRATRDVVPIPMPGPMPESMPTIKSLLNRVPAACNGKSFKMGGLDKRHIIDILRHLDKDIRGSRETLLARLCATSHDMMFPPLKPKSKVRTRRRRKTVKHDRPGLPPPPAPPAPPAPPMPKELEVHGSIPKPSRPLADIVPYLEDDVLTVVAQPEVCPGSGFQQHIDICWFHATATALLLSTDSRRNLWNRIFRYGRKLSHQVDPDVLSMVPFALRKQPFDLPAHIMLTLEIMRKGLELSMISLEGLGIRRRGSISSCSEGTFDMICSLADWCVKSTPKEGRPKVGMGGKHRQLLSDLKQHLPIHVETILSPTVVSGRFKTPVDSLVIIVSTAFLTMRHAVSAYYCGGCLALL